ncbi:MAG: hypothetical protein JNM14_16310 [Ferruginibacter sp.]|nr:hypothetical protein [Ferruginibacter sp.]
MKQLFSLSLFMLLSCIGFSQYIHIFPLEGKNACGTNKTTKFIIVQGANCEQLYNQGIDQTEKLKAYGQSVRTSWHNCGDGPYSPKGKYIAIVSRLLPDGECFMRVWEVGFGNSKADAIKNAKGQFSGFEESKDDVVEYSGLVTSSIPDPTLKYKD